METTRGLIQLTRKVLGQDRGYGVLVEASDSQIATAIRLAVAEYARYHPIRSYQSFVAAPGMHVYTPNPPISGVLELDFLEEIEGQVASPEVALLGGRLSTLGASFQFSSPVGWAVYKQWKTVAERVFSSKPDYRFVPEDGKVYLYIPIQSTKVTLVGVLDVDAGFDEETPWEDVIEEDDTAPSIPETTMLDATLQQIPSRHMRWIRALTKAKTKEIIGYQRRKFISGIPSGDSSSSREGSGTTTFDGKEMVAEGIKEWETLINDMMSATQAMVPVIG